MPRPFGKIEAENCTTLSPRLNFSSTGECQFVRRNHPAVVYTRGWRDAGPGGRWHAMASVSCLFAVAVTGIAASDGEIRKSIRDKKGRRHPTQTWGKAHALLRLSPRSFTGSLSRRGHASSGLRVHPLAPHDAKTCEIHTKISRNSRRTLVSERGCGVRA